MKITKIPVFDIGDTILPSHEKINQKVREELKREGVEDGPELPINKYNIYKVSEIREWLNKNNIDAEAQKLKGAYIEWEKEFLRSGVIEELKKINEEFGPIGFISDNSIAARKFYKEIFESEGLNYEGFVVSEEVGVAKPDRKIFEAFIEQRDESPERFVYFGNYVDRDKAAENTGMHFVWDDQYHVFDSYFRGPTIHRLTYENVKEGLREVEEKEGDKG